MPTMKALKAHPFGGRNVQPDETYEATEGEARTVRALGWAKDAEQQAAPAARARRQYRRRDMTAEQ